MTEQQTRPATASEPQRSQERSEPETAQVTQPTQAET